jgi:hypothetical protein
MVTPYYPAAEYDALVASFAARALTVEAFQAESQALLSKAFTYKPTEIGASKYIEMMSALADAYPEFDNA